MDKWYNSGMGVLNPNTIRNILGQRGKLIGHPVSLSTYE
jgi:hypothetical protein